MKQPIQASFRITLSSQLNYEKVVEGLGKICVEFQRLETNLKAALGLLVDPDNIHIGTIVTAQLSFGAILDLMYALYHYRFNDPLELEKLDLFLGECKRAEERRNQIIHSHWQVDFEAGKGAIRTKYTAKNRKELKRQKETLSQADMEKITEELKSLRTRFLQDWATRIHTHLLQMNAIKNRTQ